MIDARHAFVQGKGYGRTNIVALNRDNVQVFNSAVTVTSPRESGTVTLNRGESRVNSVAFSLIIPESLSFDPTDADRDGVPDRREWGYDRDRDGRPDQWDRHDDRYTSYWRR